MKVNERWDKMVAFEKMMRLRYKEVLFARSNDPNLPDEVAEQIPFERIRYNEDKIEYTQKIVWDTQENRYEEKKLRNIWMKENNLKKPY